MKIKTTNAKFGNPNSMMNAQVNNPHEKDFPSTYVLYIMNFLESAGTFPMPHPQN